MRDAQKPDHISLINLIGRLMDAGKLLFGRLDEKNWVGRWLRLDIQVYLRDL